MLLLGKVALSTMAFHTDAALYQNLASRLATAFPASGLGPLGYNLIYDAVHVLTLAAFAAGDSLDPPALATGLGKLDDSSAPVVQGGADAFSVLAVMGSIHLQVTSGLLDFDHQTGSRSMGLTSFCLAQQQDSSVLYRFGAQTYNPSTMTLDGTGCFD